MKYWKAIKASAVRFSYLIHGSIGVFLTVYLTQNSYYWFTSAALILFMIEIILTLKCNRESGEWRWFTPLVLIYLSLVVPIVWILEYTMLELRIDVMNRTQSTTCPVSLQAVLANPCTDAANGTSSTASKEEYIVTKLEADIYNQKLMISTTYQQTLMLILILGRWVLPKGGLTRDELSQLLLVYIGVAADMLEFSSETMKLKDIACRRGIFTVILCVWSWSTLQFTMCLTSKKRRRRIQVIKLNFGKNTRLFSGLNELTAYLSHVEIWALMTDAILQDAPYLVTRLYILFNYDVVDQSLVFFTCKNALLMILQSYRLYVVLHESHKQRRKYLETERANINAKDSGIASSEPTINGSAMMSVDESEYNSEESPVEMKANSHTVNMAMAIFAISTDLGLPKHYGNENECRPNGNAGHHGESEANGSHVNHEANESHVNHGFGNGGFYISRHDDDDVV